MGQLPLLLEPLSGHLNDALLDRNIDVFSDDCPKITTMLKTRIRVLPHKLVIFDITRQSSYLFPRNIAVDIKMETYEIQVWIAVQQQLKMSICQ